MKSFNIKGPLLPVRIRNNEKMDYGIIHIDLDNDESFFCPIIETRWFPYESDVSFEEDCASEIKYFKCFQKWERYNLKKKSQTLQRYGSRCDKRKEESKKLLFNVGDIQEYNTQNMKHIILLALSVKNIKKSHPKYHNYYTAVFHSIMNAYVRIKPLLNLETGYIYEKDTNT
jgi:hypothetical protein